MRAVPTLLLIVSLLSVPLGSSMALLSPSVVPAAQDHAPLPVDLSDATLYALLAGHGGLAIEPPAPVEAPTGDTLPAAVLRLAERAQAPPLGLEDVRAFAELDPRVSAPVHKLLLAVERAWDLRDVAYASLSVEEQRELAQLTRTQDFSSPRHSALADQVNETALVEGMILLLDTLEGIVLPQLQDAVRQGAWPASAVADPVGVLRLGGTGDDIEIVDRIVQIDPKGDDQHHNNAGATNVFNDFPLFSDDPTRTLVRTPIALSVDFEGNDQYEMLESVPAQGSGSAGLGILLDFSGDDTYRCVSLCQGDSHGLLRDFAGNDSYRAAYHAMGYSSFGVLRDDTGNDNYHGNIGVGGVNFGTGRSFESALLWDRAGTDRYYSYFFDSSFGYGTQRAMGWFVDEGPETDSYESNSATGADVYACNDCTWTAGGNIHDPGHYGRGNDNAGGLAYLLTKQSGLFPDV